MSYRVGKVDGNGLKSSWIAFEGNNRWHFFLPLWILSAVVGYNPGDVVTLEKDGRAMLQQEQATQGTETYRFDDTWFCPNPEFFVHHCFPEDISWQNLPANKQMLTLDDFLLMPYLRFSYFEANLHLITHRTCIISSTNGKCLIAVIVEPEIARHLHFSYTLSIFGHDTSGLNVEDLPLLVFCSRSKYTSSTVVKFDIRFPTIGHYLLETYAGYDKNELDACFQFKIICDEADPECQKLPIQAGVVAWGHGPSAMDAGIKRTSLKSGECQLIRNSRSDSNLETEIKVNVDEEAFNENEFSAYIFGSDSADTETKKGNVIARCTYK